MSFLHHVFTSHYEDVCTTIERIPERLCDFAGVPCRCPLDATPLKGTYIFQPMEIPEEIQPFVNVSRSTLKPYASNLWGCNKHILKKQSGFYYIILRLTDPTILYPMIHWCDEPLILQPISPIIHWSYFALHPTGPTSLVLSCLVIYSANSQTGYRAEGGAPPSRGRGGSLTGWIGQTLPGVGTPAK